MTPLASDVFGQISIADIELVGRLFPVPNMDDVIEHRWEESEYNSVFFGLDDWDALPKSLEATIWLPIARLEYGKDDDNHLKYCGLFLLPIEGADGIPKYQRIGFSGTSSTGDLAGSRYFLGGWTLPPWDQTELQTIRLI